MCLGLLDSVFCGEKQEMKQLLAEIWSIYIAPRLMALIRNVLRPDTLWIVVPSLAVFVLLWWGVNYIGISPNDMSGTVNGELQQFSHDARALTNGEAMARIQREMSANKFEIEMPQTVEQDKESKQMAQELHAARQEMLEQRRRELDKYTQTIMANEKK